MSQRRVVITGMGTVTPLGHSVEALWRAILATESGVSPTELFDASTYPSQFSAQVRGFRLADHIPNADDHSTVSRHASFALAAAQQAWNTAGLGDLTGLDRSRVGIYLGSGEGSLDFDAFTGCLIDA